MKKIKIFATGGTIAGSGAAGKSAAYEAGHVDIAKLLQDLPDLGDIAQVSMEQICNKDSNDLTLSDWLLLAKKLNQAALESDLDGFVITHGTDTLEETAYFLNLVFKSEKPLVLTGAMRPATATSADGPMNLYQAIALAAHPDSVGQGVIALFSDNIFSSRDIRKTSNFKIDAFQHNDFACIGYMRDEIPYFYTRSFKKHTVATPFDISALTALPKVEIVSYYVGADPAVLDHYLYREKVDGIVIAGSGSGNYAKAWKTKLEALAAVNIPIVRASRVSGIVLPAVTMDVATTICANTLTPQKARILLMLALTKTHQIDAIKAMFQEY